MTTATKKCSKCYQVMSVREFNLNKSCRDGYQNYCRECQAEYRVAYKSRKGAAYFAELEASWRRRNPFRYRAMMVQMDMRQRGGGVALGCDNPATLDDVEALFHEAVEVGRHCPLCTEEMSFEIGEGKGGQPMDAATVDHILPISCGGKHTRDNMRIICRRCNQSRYRGRFKDLEPAEDLEEVYEDLELPEGFDILATPLAS